MILPPRDKKYTAVGLAVLLSVVAVATGFGIAGSAIIAIAGGTAATFLLVNACWLQIPFFPYDRILSAVTDGAGLVWEREGGIRIDVGGVHQSIQVYYPKVVSCGDGYRMYYRAGGKEAIIASAFSADGLAWREEPGVRIGLDNARDLKRIEGHEVVFLNGGWRMYYSGFHGQLWRIYSSRSQDGLTWSAGPLCIDAAPGDALPHVKAPSIVVDSAGFRLFFMAFSKEVIHIRTSYSGDGEVWSSVAECDGMYLDGFVVRNPCVRQMGDGLLRMYFSERECEVNPIGGRIVSAVSRDGLFWHREPGVRIGPGNAQDRHGIFSVDLLPMPVGWRIYYTGYWGWHWLELFTRFQYRWLAGHRPEMALVRSLRLRFSR